MKGDKHIKEYGLVAQSGFVRQKEHSPYMAAELASGPRFKSGLAHCKEFFSFYVLFVTRVTKEIFIYQEIL